MIEQLSVYTTCTICTMCMRTLLLNVISSTPVTSLESFAEKVSFYFIQLQRSLSITYGLAIFRYTILKMLYFVSFQFIFTFSVTRQQLSFNGVKLFLIYSIPSKVTYFYKFSSRDNKSCDPGSNLGESFRNSSILYP